MRWLILCVLLCLIIITYLLTINYSLKTIQSVSESFSVADHADGLSWDFQSPYSEIKNYNQRTQIPSFVKHNAVGTVADPKVVKPDGSNFDELNQTVVTPRWIYPYAMLNRNFHTVTQQVATYLEKLYNHGKPFRQTPRKDRTIIYTQWKDLTPFNGYEQHNWTSLPIQPKQLVESVMTAMNQRIYNNNCHQLFGFKTDNIKYKTISGPSSSGQGEFIVIIRTYKTATLCNVKYDDDRLNCPARDNFERPLLIWFNCATGKPRYLRFIDVTHPPEDMPSNLSSVTVYELEKSRDPNYRLVSNKQAETEYQKQLEQMSKHSDWKCFRKLSGNQLLPNSRDVDLDSHVIDETACAQIDGLWAQKCHQDSDCPYYKSNRNYSNRFGGCNQTTGYCQLPTGMTSLTYRQADQKSKKLAQCYNCPHGFLGKKSLGQCCTAVKNPDWKFNGDISARFQARQALNKRGLLWSNVKN
jgi:hypothetical protein